MRQRLTWLGCAVIGASTATALAVTQEKDWPLKGGGFAQQQFSPLAQITDRNIGDLGLAWSADIDAPMGLTAEPLVLDGVIYLSAPQSIVYAIDARSGRVNWRFDPKVRMDYSTQNSYAARVNRGVAVADGKVFVATGDCRLVAIAVGDGAKLWDSQICDPQQTGSTGAPRVANGKVFIGYNGSDDEVRGSLVAFDANTGREAWRFWTVPGDPAKGFESPALKMASHSWKGPEYWWHGGGAVWDGITFDSTTGFLLFGTAGAHAGEGTTKRPTSKGRKLFAGCIVAVKVDTGEYVWHYQTSTGNEQTENTHIVIADLRMGAAMRHVAMTVPKNGSLYVLDATTGRLLSSAALVKGRARTETGLHHPGAPEAQRSGADVVSGADLPPWTVHNWWPMSFSPATGLVYVPITNRLRRGSDASSFEGNLVAWDPVTQSERWRVRQALAVNGGVLSSAGNLVFQGEGNGEFVGYAADTGRKVWSMQVGSAIDAVPVSYSLDGEQYILVPVGWGSASRLFGPAAMMTTDATKYGPARLLVFKLGAHAPLSVPRREREAVPKPPVLAASAQSLRRGKNLYEAHLCWGCHSPDLDGSGAWTEGGGVPDLRYMPELSHQNWNATVLGGTHRAAGMLNFGVDQVYPEIARLSSKDAADIHAYVIEQSWKAYLKK